MLWVVSLLVVSGMYLAVNAKVARAGRDVLTLEERRADLQRHNAELAAEVAENSSPALMMERALALGFRAARPDEIEYILIPGGIPVSEFVAPKPVASEGSGEARLSPAYTETLSEWIERFIARESGT